MTKIAKIASKGPKYEKMEAFVSIKDHKQGFPNTVKCRLLNPSKTHIGRVCKVILDNINEKIRAKIFYGTKLWPKIMRCCSAFQI